MSVRSPLLLSLSLFITFSLRYSALAADDAPAGMVMVLSGSTTPTIAAMAEIPVGIPLRLASGTELTFLHYARCKLITVTDGSLTVTRTDFSTDGKIVAEKDGPCPRVHQLSSNAPGTVSGGLVMRGVGSVPRWPLDREFVLAGTGSADINAAAIYAEDRLDTPLVTLDLSGHQARFPADTAPLAANGRYLLRLTIGNRAQPVDIPFIGTAPDGPSLLVVLRGP
jgi:hypothetical protein